MAPRLRRLQRASRHTPSTEGGGLEDSLYIIGAPSEIVFDDDDLLPPVDYPQWERTATAPEGHLREQHAHAKRRILSDFLLQPRQVVRKTTKAGHKIPAIYDKVVRKLFPSHAAGVPRNAETSSFESDYFIIHVDHECMICRCTIEDTQICAPCGHYFDPECLLDLVEASTRDESQFPPRCCQQHIPPSLFEPYMTPSLSALFSEKKREYSTPRRVYCANPSCSRFIGPRETRGAARSLSCPSCPTHTCNRCTTAVDPDEGHKCERPKSHREVLELASRKGWSRCPTCGQLIELHSGCHHMTCVCGTQFCYLCRARWKSCGCAQWEDIRLPFDDFGVLEMPGIPGLRRAPTRRMRPNAPPFPPIPESPPLSPISPISTRSSRPLTPVHRAPSSPVLPSALTARPPTPVRQTLSSRIHDRPLPRPPKSPSDTVDALWTCKVQTPQTAFVLARGVEAQRRRLERKHTFGRPRGFSLHIERESVVCVDTLPTHHHSHLP